MKTLWKSRFLGCFSKAKGKECDLKVWNIFDQFGITISCLATVSLEVGGPVSFKVATKSLLEVKTFWKNIFLGSFSKGKTEECEQKVWIVFDQFGIIIPCFATFSLEVGAHVSLKVTTKGSIRVKNILKI